MNTSCVTKWMVLDFPVLDLFSLSYFSYIFFLFFFFWIGSSISSLNIKFINLAYTVNFIGNIVHDHVQYLIWLELITVIQYVINFVSDEFWKTTAFWLTVVTLTICDFENFKLEFFLFFFLLFTISILAIQDH